MGEEQAGVTTLEELDVEERKKDDEKTSVQEVGALRDEIEEIRDDLGEYISELDRRRHDALDLRLQLREHKEAVVAVGAGLVVLVAGLVAWRVRAARTQTVLEHIKEALAEKLGASFDAGRRKSDVRGTLVKALIGIAAGAAAAAVSTAVKSAVARRVDAEPTTAI